MIYKITNVDSNVSMVTCGIRVVLKVWLNATSGFVLPEIRWLLSVINEKGVNLNFTFSLEGTSKSPVPKYAVKPHPGRMRNSTTFPVHLKFWRFFETEM